MFCDEAVHVQVLLELIIGCDASDCAILHRVIRSRHEMQTCRSGDTATSSAPFPEEPPRKTSGDHLAIRGSESSSSGHLEVGLRRWTGHMT